MAEPGILFEGDEEFDDLLSLNEGVLAQSDFPAKIEFPKPSEDEPEEIDPYINLDDPSFDLERLEGADELVAPPVIIIAYNYPLRDEFLFLHQSSDDRGFTRAELAESIAMTYQKIYREEDAAVGPTGNLRVPRFNRAKSNGPYGIRNHHLQDLVLSGVSLDENSDLSFPTYELEIDS